MMYASNDDFIKDFIERTIYNYRVLEKGPYEVTALINSAIGVIILPYEKGKIKFTDNFIGEDAVEFAHRITENFYETVLEEMKDGIYIGDKKRWIDIYKTYLIWDRFRESKIGRDINEYIEAVNTEKGYDTTKRGEAYLNISNDMCLLKIFLAKIADDND